MSGGTFPDSHWTIKNVEKINNYFALKELEVAFKKFVDRYNNYQYHESLKNLAPRDVYFGSEGMI